MKVLLTLYEIFTIRLLIHIEKTPQRVDTVDTRLLYVPYIKTERGDNSN